MVLPITKTQILSFKISPEMKDKLIRISEANERSYAFIIRKALEKYLQENKNATTII